jgi:hypothetical protein
LYNGEAHGYRDDATFEAITKYQYRKGFVVDGEPSPVLKAELTTALNKQIAQSFTEIPPGRIGPPTEDDFRLAAARLKIDGPTLKALHRVEAGRMGGFASDGSMIILFEPHLFSRHTQRKYDESHPNVSTRMWTPSAYPRTQAGRWAQFNEAAKLDEDAAFKSASFGAFQILGQNYRQAGFKTPQEFVLFMAQSEGAQLEAFVRVIENNKMREALDKKDWRAFARSYNGPGFAERYAQLLSQAYAGYVAEFAAANAAAALDAETPEPATPEQQAPVSPE